MPGGARFRTHYYLPDRRPFLNLSELDDASIAAIDREMAALARGRQFRPSPRYMEWRRLTERRMRGLFLDRGGKPERTAPHYFVLGGSRWFEGLAVGMQSITMPVASLPPAVTSVTLPDSFTAMEFGARFGLPAEPKPYHGRVFLLDEIDDVMAEFGLPTASWDQRHEDWREWPETAYVEIQVWSERTPA